MNKGPFDFDNAIEFVLKKIDEIVRKVVREELSLSTPSAGEWMGRDDVAQFLGYKSAYISELVRRRGLPCHRIGRKMRFRRSEVEDWQQGGC